MGKKRKLEKSIESFKEQIELHFGKLEADIKLKKKNMAEYHSKEINQSLIEGLINKMNQLGKTDKILLEEYKRKLENLQEKIEKLKE